MTSETQGPVRGEPAAPDSGDVSVYYTAVTGAIYRSGWDPSTRTWSAWILVPGNTAATAAADAASESPTHVDLASAAARQVGAGNPLPATPAAVDPGTGSTGNSATRWNGAVPRRRATAPFRGWSGRRSARRGARGARGLFVSRWRWLILVTMVVAGAAAMLSYSRTPTYKSAADILVQPRLFAAGTAPQAPDMGSEKAAAGSTVVLDIAARALGVPTDTLAKGVSVSVPLNTDVLHVSCASVDPRYAQQCAQAVATAYVSYWLAEQPSLDPRTSARPTRAQILNTSVITPAKLPTAPASPNHVVDIGIAVIIGLLLAAGTAYVRDRLDDRLRGPDELEENGGGSVLGVVPAGSRGRSDPIVVRRPDTPGAEAYRELRILLMRIAEQRAAKSLLVTSPTGEVQTTVSANVAASFAMTGRRVILVHADMRHPRGHESFGDGQGLGLADVLEGRADLASVLTQAETPGLQVIAAGVLVGDIGTALHPARLGEVVGRLSAAADIVVIDAPAALAGSDIATMVEVVDMVLLVGDARGTTRAQVRAASDRLAHVRQKLIGCVLVNYGRRIRIVTPPLSVITGHEDHVSLPHRRDQDENGQAEDDGSAGPARWLLDPLGGPLEFTEHSVDQANGWQRPATSAEGLTR
jgi:polysaccharide biosynthesis transport protein